MDNKKLKTQKALKKIENILNNLEINDAEIRDNLKQSALSYREMGATWSEVDTYICEREEMLIDGRRN